MHPSITYRHLNNLLWKYATGESLPKPSPKNLRDTLVEQGRAIEAMRLESGTHVLIALLKANLPYEVIKFSMGVK